MEKRKRKQVKNACDVCRRMHTACDNNRPCSRCERLGRECVDSCKRIKVNHTLYRRNQLKKVQKKTVKGKCKKARRDRRKETVRSEGTDVRRLEESPKQCKEIQVQWYPRKIKVGRDKEIKISLPPLTVQDFLF